MRAYYGELGEAFVHALDEMILFDAVIYNTDRHFGNFGVLVDSKTNQIVAPAPLFDHGNALFSLAGLDVFESGQGMMNYAKIQQPRVYDDFVAEARSVLTHEWRSRLRHLLSFRLKRHSRYNLPPKRLTLIEKQVSQRVAEILE